MCAMYHDHSSKVNVAYILTRTLPLWARHIADNLHKTLTEALWVLCDTCIMRHFQCINAKRQVIHAPAHLLAGTLAYVLSRRAIIVGVNVIVMLWDLVLIT